MVLKHLLVKGPLKIRGISNFDSLLLSKLFELSLSVSWFGGYGKLNPTLLAAVSMSELNLLNKPTHFLHTRQVGYYVLILCAYHFL